MSSIDITINTAQEMILMYERKMLKLKNYQLYRKMLNLQAWKDKIKYPTWSVKEIVKKQLVAENDYIKHGSYSAPSMAAVYDYDKMVLSTVDGEGIEVPYVPQFVLENPRWNDVALAFLQSSKVFVLLDQSLDGYICEETTTPEGETKYKCLPKITGHYRGQLGEIMLPTPIETYDGFNKIILERYQITDWYHGILSTDTFDVYVDIIIQAKVVLRVQDLTSGNEYSVETDALGYYISSTYGDVEVFVHDAYVPLYLSLTGIYTALKMFVLYQGKFKRLVAYGV